MPPSSIRLGVTQRNDVAEICTIGPEKLARAADGLSSGGIIIDRGVVQKVLGEHVGEDDAQPLARFLFGVVAYMRQSASSVEEALSAIERALLAQPKEEERFKTWPRCRPELARLLGNASIRVSAKAFDLSYDFERLYTDGRFITSIRPIFDDGREAILGTTVVQTLRLEYQLTGGEAGSYSFAMDRADIEQLLRACEEALRKATITSRDVRQVWGMPTIMPGEEVE